MYIGLNNETIIAFIPFLSFIRKQKKQDSDFQQVCGLITRNISALWLKQVAFFFKDMSNSIDFNKGIFLNVISVLIIVPGIYGNFHDNWVSYNTAN